MQEEFCILDWRGYPPGLPRPPGPLRLLTGDEYNRARTAADKANDQCHRTNWMLAGLHIHEVHPVKFGGNPTRLDNKLALTLLEHAAVSSWWQRLHKHILEMNR